MISTDIDILQVAAWYPPHSLGGTEIYLTALVQELAKLGVRSAISVPKHADAQTDYDHAGARVFGYLVNETPAPNEIRLGLPHLDFDIFLNILRRNAGAIYHQHSWTRGCGAHHLRAARELGFKTVLTVHVPGNICLRGTMMRFGETPCVGPQVDRLCGACWAHNRGLSYSMSGVIATLPKIFAATARRFTGRIATALSARALANEKAAQIRQMVANADRIVAVCQWLYDALIEAGVPGKKLVLSRQGVSPRFAAEARAANANRSDNHEPLRLLYLGRFDPVKGIDIAVNAVRMLNKNFPILLTIHGIPDGHAEKAYEADIRRMAAGDTRVKVEPPVQRNELAHVMAKHDVLVVPSTWLETGPLVVLEARAAGLPILGSKLGGIAEIVQESEDGMLLPVGDVDAWVEAIARLADSKASGRLSRQSYSVRTMSDAAVEMKTLYESLRSD